MKRTLSLFLLSSASLIFISCLSNDDDIYYYEDSALTSFSLGTQKFIVDTVGASGADSTYKTTLDCSGYKFYIDQINRVVYNPDSLPYGIDNTKIIANANSKNSGYVFIKSLISDSLFYFSSSDSIDFSSPRTLRVYSLAATTYRDYTVSVNVHKEKANQFSWKLATTNNQLASMTGMKGVACGGYVYVFGTNGTNALAYRASESDASTWTEITPNVTFDNDAYKGIVVKGDTLYVYNDGSVLYSIDGTTWETISQVSLKQLLGASPFRLYALTDDNNIMYSTDNGASWSEDEMDTSGDSLPIDNVNFACQPLQTNVNTYKLFLTGTTSTNSSSWTKVEENADYSIAQPWAYYTFTSGDTNITPNLENLQVVKYNSKLMAIGGNGIGNYTAEAFDNFYTSRDGGLTWQTDSLYELPEGFYSSTTSFTLVNDSQNYLWLICGESGQIWHGRLSQLGWTEERKSFEY